MEHENVTVPVYKSRRGVWLVCIFISLFSFPSCKNGSDSSVPAVPSYTKVSPDVQALQPHLLYRRV